MVMTDELGCCHRATSRLYRERRSPVRADSGPWENGQAPRRTAVGLSCEITVAANSCPSSVSAMVLSSPCGALPMLSNLIEGTAHAPPTAAQTGCKSSSWTRRCGRAASPGSAAWPGAHGDAARRAPNTSSPVDGSCLARGRATGPVRPARGLTRASLKVPERSSSERPRQPDRAGRP